MKFELSREDIIKLCQQNCYYCGEPPKQKLPENRVKNGHFIHNGIDRKDNNIGYTMDNCVPCCTKCNMSKRTMSITEFLSWIKKVYEFTYLKKESTE